MRAGDRAWLVLSVGVVAYELAATDEELLSSAADRYVLHHPWLVRFVAFALAAHVCNSIPERYDVIHQLVRLRRR